jgi:plastocyanin
MKNFDFSPMALTVAIGTTVTSKNLDGEPHAIASADGPFFAPARSTRMTAFHSNSKSSCVQLHLPIHPRMMTAVTAK